jgi:transposase
MDESYFGGRRKGNRGRGAAGKVPVFGILERGGKVKVEVVGDVKEILCWNWLSGRLREAV